MIINAAEITSGSQDAVARERWLPKSSVNRTYTNLGLLGGRSHSEQQVAGAVQE